MIGNTCPCQKALLCGYLRSIAICDPFPLYGNKGLQDYLQLFKISMILTAASSTWKENTIIMGVEHFPFYCSVFGTLDPLIWSHHASYRRGLYKMGGTNLKRQRITEISNRDWNKFQFMCRPLDGFNVSFSVSDSRTCFSIDLMDFNTCSRHLFCLLMTYLCISTNWAKLLKQVRRCTNIKVINVCLRWTPSVPTLFSRLSPSLLSSQIPG
mgnify:CR=1 FL=1